MVVVALSNWKIFDANIRTNFPKYINGDGSINNYAAAKCNLSSKEIFYNIVVPKNYNFVQKMLDKICMPYKYFFPRSI